MNHAIAPGTVITIPGDRTHYTIKANLGSTPVPGQTRYRATYRRQNDPTRPLQFTNGLLVLDSTRVKVVAS